MKLTLMGIAALAVMHNAAAHAQQKTLPLQVQEMELREQLLKPADEKVKLDGVVKSRGHSARSRLHQSSGL